MNANEWGLKLLIGQGLIKEAAEFYQIQIIKPSVTPFCDVASAIRLSPNQISLSVYWAVRTNINDQTEWYVERIM